MKTILCIDFDGTITNTDVLDELIIYVKGKLFLIEWINNLISKKISYPEYLRMVCEVLDIGAIEFGSVENFVKTIVKTHNITIDPMFEQLQTLCDKHNIPLYIISGNLKKIIQLFVNHPPENILAHDYFIVENKIIECYDQSIDPKSAYINTYFSNDKYNVVYVGEGTSDISVVNNCDVYRMYAKQNYPLAKRCDEKNQAYTPFENLSDVVDKIRCFL
jgi:HAD superfamily phosphoserine phosphatase-like hydrolase